MHTKKLDRPMTLETARNKNVLRPGDVLFYEGIGAISWAIRTVTSYPPSKVSHVALLGDHRDEAGHIVSFSVVEFREFKGGREVALELEVQKNSGRIHVFRPSEDFVSYIFDETTGDMTENRKPFDAARVVKKMRQLTGLPYNWRMIICTYLWKLPVLRMVICNRHSILKYFVTSLSGVLARPLQERLLHRCNLSLDRFVCSTAIDYAFSKAGYRLICKASSFVTPDDLFRSPHLHYVCTLI